MPQLLQLSGFEKCLLGGLEYANGETVFHRVCRDRRLHDYPEVLTRLIEIVSESIDDMEGFIQRANHDGVTCSKLCEDIRQTGFNLILDPYFTDSPIKQVLDFRSTPAAEQVPDLLEDKNSFLAKKLEELEDCDPSNWFKNNFSVFDLSKPIISQIKSLDDTTFHWIDSIEKLNDILPILNKELLEVPVLGVDLEWSHANHVSRHGLKEG